MTGGGLKAPGGEAYFHADDEGANSDAVLPLPLPATVTGNDDWDKFPERRPRPRVPPVVPGGGPFAATRMALPVYQFRQELLRGLDANRVTIVEGDTGCGKTTQVPQYVLEEAAATGQPVYAVCTQPRRISAMGVAARVAEERGEEVGGTVGYSIRLETKAGPGTQLLFCTTGVLLRRMETDPLLETVTTNYKHLYTNSKHLYAIAKHLYTNSKHLYTNSKHLYAILKHLYTNSKHLYTNSKHLYTNSKYLYTNSKHLYTNSKHLYTNSKHL